MLALDAKMTFDDNALYRQTELEALRDFDEEDPSETEAKRYDLVVHQARRQHRLHGQRRRPGDGDDGHHQALRRPARELPRRRRQRHRGAVTAAFKIITADPKVRGIFVNIFGGIMKCDTIAAGVIAAVKQVGLKVPLVVRLEGTNVELGRKMLAESGLAVTSANDMADGAQKRGRRSRQREGEA